MNAPAASPPPRPVSLLPVTKLNPRDVRAASVIDAIRRLSPHLASGRKRQAVLILLFMLVGAFAEMLSIGAVLPFLTLLAVPDRVREYPLFGRIVDAAGLSPSELLPAATLLFVTAAVGAMVIRLLLLRAAQRFVFAVGHDLSVELYDHILHQTYLYHTLHNSAEVQSGIQKVNTVTSMFLLPAMQGVISITVMLFILGALAWADPQLAAIAIVSFGGIYLLISLFVRRLLARNSGRLAALATQRIQTIQEGMGSIRDVLLDRAQPVYLRKFSRLDDDFRRNQAISTFVANAPRYVVEGLGLVLIALLAIHAARQPGGLIAVLPTLGALAIGAQRLMPLLQQVYFGWSQMMTNTANLTNILDVLEQPVVKPAADLAPLPFRQGIAFDDVGFRYAEDGERVLDGVSISIPRGATVGLIGRTGSGKSTVLDILMGLLEPGQGHLTIDGTPVATPEDRFRWQMNISHVPQAIFLADDSIAQNIAFGVEPDAIDLDRVRAAARMARAAEFIEALPEGYATGVGEKGMRLSGGQRQRIGIARALFSGKSVLVLDEATSALDTETEEAVMESVRALGDDLTIIIVAHRLSTLRHCSLVLRLEDGRVAEQGSYHELIGRHEGAAPRRATVQG